MYPDTLLLSERLRDGHSATWQRIAEPGAFFSGAQRLEFIRIAREGLTCPLCEDRRDALSPNSVQGEHDTASELPPAVVDMIHRIRTDPGRLTRSWFDLVTSEISMPEYVEIVSVVTVSVIIDTLHNALGLGVPALPQLVSGSPQGGINADAVDDGAWLPILAVPDADSVSDTGLPQVPNIARSLGLVPSALQLFFDTFRPHYALKDIDLSISQGQAEFVAARVSAINECFY